MGRAVGDGFAMLGSQAPVEHRTLRRRLRVIGGMCSQRIAHSLGVHVQRNRHAMDGLQGGVHLAAHISEQAQAVALKAMQQ